MLVTICVLDVHIDLLVELVQVPARRELSAHPQQLRERDVIAISDQPCACMKLPAAPGAASLPLRIWLPFKEQGLILSFLVQYVPY